MLITGTFSRKKNQKDNPGAKIRTLRGDPYHPRNCVTKPSSLRSSTHCDLSGDDLDQFSKINDSHFTDRW